MVSQHKLVAGWGLQISPAPCGLGRTFCEYDLWEWLGSCVVKALDSEHDDCDFNTKLGTHIVDGRTSTWTDLEVKRSRSQLRLTWVHICWTYGFCSLPDAACRRVARAERSLADERNDSIPTRAAATETNRKRRTLWWSDTRFRKQKENGLFTRNRFVACAYLLALCRPPESST